MDASIKPKTGIKKWWSGNNGSGGVKKKFSEGVKSVFKPKISRIPIEPVEYNPYSKGTYALNPFKSINASASASQYNPKQSINFSQNYHPLFKNLVNSSETEVNAEAERIVSNYDPNNFKKLYMVQGKTANQAQKDLASNARDQAKLTLAGNIFNNFGKQFSGFEGSNTNSSLGRSPSMSNTISNPSDKLDFGEGYNPNSTF